MSVDGVVVIAVGAVVVVVVAGVPIQVLEIVRYVRRSTNK